MSAYHARTGCPSALTDSPAKIAIEAGTSSCNFVHENGRGSSLGIGVGVAVGAGEIVGAGIGATACARVLAAPKIIRVAAKKRKALNCFVINRFFNHNQTMKTDDLIDAFVAHINASPREPLSEYTLPFTKSVHVGAAPDGAFGFGDWDWNIKRSDQIDWIDKLNTRLPRLFPPSFYSLVSRYIFPLFEFGPLYFFANTPEENEEIYELRSAIFCDKQLSPVLLSHGFIQFARPYIGNYDAICFDTNHRASKDEYSIVLIEHEAAFDGQIHILEVLASSFPALLEEHMK